MIKERIEKMTYKRIFRLYLAVFIVLTIVSWSNPANAESGVLLIEKAANPENIGSGSSSGVALDFGNFTYDASTYNYVTEFNYTLGATAAHPNESRVWSFTVGGDVTASSYSGSARWSKADKRLYYYFPSDLKLTKTTGYVNLTNFVILSSGSSTDFNSEFTAGQSYSLCSASLVALNSVTNPIEWRRVNSLTACSPMGSTRWNVTVRTKNYAAYEVTYPSSPSNSFLLSVNKRYEGNSQTTIVNLSNEYSNYSGFPETALNNINISYLGIYDRGIFINITDSAGSYDSEWINTSGCAVCYNPPAVPDSYVTNPNGSGIVNYTNTYVRYRDDPIHNNSYQTIQYDILILSNRSDFATVILPVLKYYIDVTDPSGLKVWREDIGVTCSKDKPFWDIFDWFTHYACAPTRLSKQYHLVPPAQNWTNGTYTATLYEDYYNNQTLLSQDTVNVLADTGFLGTCDGCVSGGSGGGSGGTQTTDLGNGLTLLIHGWFGNSAATDFIISLVIILLCSFLSYAVTKKPIFASAGFILGVGISVSLTLMSLVWAVMILVLTALAFAKMLRSGF